MVRTKNRREKREGAIYALLLVSISVIVALLAITLDGGRLLDQRRSVQQAADLAALAAAADLYGNYDVNNGLDPSGTAAAAALRIAQSNGFACDGVTSSITVNVPPTTGPFAKAAGHAEVILHANLSGSFSKCVTSSTIGAAGRGVARGRRRSIGLSALASTGIGVQNSNSGSIRVLGGGAININSTGPSALTLGTGSLSASSAEVVGGYSGSTANVSGPVDTAAQPASDPLALLQGPDASTYAIYPFQTYTSGTTTLSPGVYRGGFKILGTATVTLQPGVYILDGGGVSVTGTASLVGSQVMLYNTAISQASGAVNISNSGSVTLTAPTTGAYAGISIYQDRAVASVVKFTANGNMKLNGTIYAPSAQVQIADNGSGDQFGWLLAASVKMSGAGSFDVNQGAARPLIPDVHLVE